MSDAIVFISHNRIKSGKLDDLKGYAPEITEIIERDKPGTVAMLSYTNPEATEVRIVHVFPDADAMQRHLEGMDERTSVSFELMETTGYEIYGSPDEQVLGMMCEFAGRLGVGINVWPDNLSGYLRLS